MCVCGRVLLWCGTVLARDYTIRWRAPDELTYETLYVRVTWVLDNQFFCPGKFSEFPLTSQVQYSCLLCARHPALP